ncbi:MAG: hypothetical protein WC545_01375 [Patescibacteria group bacterium]
MIKTELEFLEAYCSLYSLPNFIENVGGELKEIYEFLKETPLGLLKNPCRFSVVYNEDGSCFLNCYGGSIHYKSRDDYFSGKTPGLALDSLFKVLKSGESVYVHGRDDFPGEEFSFYLYSEHGKLAVRDIKIC